MRTATGQAGAQLLGLGAERPAQVVTNADIARHADTSDEWIRARTGIVERRRAAPGEEVVDLATAAGGKALAAAGVDPSTVDLVLLASCTQRLPIRPGAPVVADRLGLGAVGAFDLNAACAGFCYGLAAADQAVRAGAAHHVLVIGAERLTDWVDPADRGTCMIFGDGAGAAVVGPADDPGIGPVAWGSDGARAATIDVPEEHRTIRMEGPAVFRWATALTPVAQRACALAGVDPGELRAFVPHQANLRIVDALARSLGARDAAVARDIVETGNTSSASVPLALSRLAERGETRSGDLALLLAFGAGLTYAAQVVRCP